MRKNKTRLVILSTLTVLLCSILFICLSTVVPVFATITSVKEDNFFIAEVDGYSYKCYTFEDDEDDQPVDGVAIAWGGLPTATPTNLTIPSSVPKPSGGTTPVLAIAKHGFRYCDFETVTLPTSIEAMYEESFAYCMNLKTFSIPYQVTKIYPSTFMDCRKLESITYSDSSGNPAFGNSTITEIGDHAFDSCVSLRDFYCPKRIALFGNSCFKNCRELVSFYFSSEIKDGNTIVNPITVKAYAFADCKSLVYVYLETNMSCIEDYAFVDCNTSMRFKYIGSNTPTYKVNGVKQNHWRDKKISSSDTSQYPFDRNQAKIESDDSYPGLRYSISSEVVPLEAAQDKPTQVQVIDQAEITSEGAYAIINKFDTPTVNVPGYFNPATGALTIPNTVNGYTVKIINESCFANNTAIKSVTFNQDLVQIRHKAFYNCPNIESLDFDSCLKLKEVSYEVFHNMTDSIRNEKLTTLILPDCLEYIGSLAFARFYAVTTFHMSMGVKAIDDLAFFRLGFNITDINDATVDLVLPKTLNDGDAQRAYFKHIQKTSSFTHNDYTRFYAVGKYAFNEAKCIRTVTMEDDPAHENDNSYICSFYSNCFHTASNLIRFKASKNLGYLGKDAFKNCTSLREVFLTYTKSEATGNNYPWCINEENGVFGGTLFFNSSPELVCYVDGPRAPGLLDNFSVVVENTSNLQSNAPWNAETDSIYVNQFKQGNTNFTNLGRAHVPTYYNVDFSSIKYWDPKTNGFVSQPTELAHYNAGIVSFVENSSHEFIACRYYFSYSGLTGTDYVDLTQVPGISDNSVHKLTTIGDECFASNETLDNTNDNGTKQPGLYFILPNTITKIGDRAFYRSTNGKTNPENSNGRYGVRVVTYKNGDGNVYNESGTAVTVASLQSTISTLFASNVADANKRGFCVLPDGVTSIGKLAFYNNIFRTVRMGGNLSYLGVGAFNANPAGSKNIRSTIENIYMTNNSIFSMDSNGIYYVREASKKMLVAQANNVAGTLNIAAGTKAIGMNACANTKYTTINLPSGLTTVYGNGFAKNRYLTTVTGTADLRYIGAMENILNSADWSDPDYTEVWDDSVKPYFENTDFRDYGYAPKEHVMSHTSAFYDCTSLETFDFKAMTQIRKIGVSAFNNCTKMYKMTGTTGYTYKQYNSGGTQTDISDGRTANTNNVLDLSGCQYLRSIGGNAFASCNSIKYVHLPNNRGTATESNLYIGSDPETSTDYAAIFSKDKGIKVLVGETAEYAHHDFGKTNNSTAHYPAGCFGTGNDVYYYISGRSDIPTDDSSTLKYWTSLGNNTYLLFNNAEDAREYFPAS